jgi:hypothetical protein
MAPKKRVARLRDYQEIVPLLKQHVPTDPAIEKTGWWGKDFDQVCEFYLPFLLAVAKTGKTPTKGALKQACQELFEGPGYIHDAWATIMDSCVSHARNARHQITSGVKTAEAVQKILKAYGYSVGKDAPTTATAPAALPEAAEETYVEDMSQGEGSSDVEIVGAPDATELEPMNEELAKAEADMAKIKAMFGPSASAPAAPSKAHLERHDSIVSIGSSDAFDEAAAPAPAPAEAEVDAPAEAKVDAPAAASSKVPAKVDLQGAGSKCGSNTKTPEGDGPLRGA